MSIRTEMDYYAETMTGLSAQMGVTCAKLGEPMRLGNPEAL